MHPDVSMQRRMHRDAGERVVGQYDAWGCITVLTHSIYATFSMHGDAGRCGVLKWLSSRESLLFWPRRVSLSAR